MTAAIDFDALLRPQSIAVVGASERPEAWGKLLTPSWKCRAAAADPWRADAGRLVGRDSSG